MVFSHYCWKVSLHHQALGDFLCHILVCYCQEGYQTPRYSSNRGFCNGCDSDFPYFKCYCLRFIKVQLRRFSSKSYVTQCSSRQYPYKRVSKKAFLRSSSYGRDLWRALEEGNKPKKGGKRKSKARPSEPSATLKKKVKKAARKPWSPNPVHEASESHTHSDSQEREAVRNETEDTTTALQPMVSEPIPT